jgi:hypothetical protein
MNTAIPDDDDTPGEFDFSRAISGKFYRPDMQIQMPVYLPPETMNALIEIATRKKVELSSLITDMLNKGYALLNTDGTPPSSLPQHPKP